MSESNHRIPQPLPFDQMPPPDLPDETQPPPSCLRVTTVMAAGEEELAIVYKKTYDFRHAEPPIPSDSQPPLINDFIPYGDGESDTPASYMEMPEIIGCKTGTDLVIRGSARSRHPVAQTQVSVHIASRPIHRADVLGNRYCGFVNGNLMFTSPEPFIDIPLRYENAYGGLDRLCQAEFIEQLNQTVPAKDMRRIRSIAEDLFSDATPLMYPRNRFGKGYILEERKDLVEGRNLPNLERPDARLTPENIIVGNPLNWPKQPLPIGFDYLDPSAFPRCAMFGLPPATIENPGPFAEVEKGYVPKDFSRGNIFTCRQEDVPQLIHPDAGRCASLGLRLPFLKNHESIRLHGMDLAHPDLEVILPSEYPVFSISGSGRDVVDMRGRIYLARINIDDRLLTLVWAARIKSPDSLDTARLMEIENDLVLNFRKE